MAAQWWGLTPRRFRRYSGDAQSEMVAIYRHHVQVEAVLAHASAQELKSNAKKG